MNKCGETKIEYYKAGCETRSVLHTCGRPKGHSGRHSCGSHASSKIIGSYKICKICGFKWSRSVVEYRSRLRDYFKALIEALFSGTPRGTGNA